MTIRWKENSAVAAAASVAAGKTTDKDREESERTAGEEDEVPSRQEIRWRREGGGGDFPYPLKYGGTGKGKWRRESRLPRAIHSAENVKNR